MKVFRYTLGHVKGETMTVSELREKLTEFPPDMPVIAEWEGTWNYFVPEQFRVAKEDQCHPDDECDCLVIDVE